jgi:hypothetical protein
LKIELFIAEIKAAPLAMHSLEFSVLDGSTPNISRIDFMITGILEPPPTSSIWFISMFCCLSY